MQLVVTNCFLKEESMLTIFLESMIGIALFALIMAAVLMLIIPGMICFMIGDYCIGIEPLDSYADLSLIQERDCLRSAVIVAKHDRRGGW